MSSMNKILVTIILICSLGISYAQVSAPKYANEFLSIGQGARGLAMGRAQVGIVDDATAGYWNPAGMMSLKNKYDISLMHSENFAGIVQNDFVGFSTIYDSTSRIGFSVIRTGVDDIPNTLNLIDDNGVINYDNVTPFGVSDYAFLGSYAKKSKLIEGLSLGVNAKIIYRHIGPFANAWGFGLDAGAQLERKGWLMGVMIKDVTTTSTYWTFNTDLLEGAFLATGNEIPENSVEVALPTISLGVGKEFTIKEKFTILPALDIDITTDGKRNVLVSASPFSLDPHAGVEVGYKRIVFLRGGINTLQKERDFDDSEFWTYSPNFGLGINIKKVKIDYALTKMATRDDGLFSHVFSINFAIN